MTRSPHILVTAASTLLLLGAGAIAQVADMVPKGMEGVGVTQMLDAAVPLDVPFTDDRGKAAKFGQYFDGRRPVLLTFNYTDCPLMCSQQLDGFVDALREMKGLVPGVDYQVITLSIDHRETFQKAALTKDRYVRELDPEMLVSARTGWHYLVGAEGNIRQVADAVGFAYKWVDPTTKYSHVPATIVLTPEGRTSRYFTGWDYGPTDLRRALVDAGRGEIGTLTDAIFYSCFQYNPDEGVFGLRVMRIGGVLAVLAMIVLVVLLRRMEPKLAEGASNNADSGNPDTPAKAEVAR